MSETSLKIAKWGDCVDIIHSCKGRAGDEAYLLLTSDWHWDHPDCDRNMLKRHLDLAKELNAGIVCIGDMLCLMQGDNDRRKTKGKVRAEHDNPDYFGSIVDDMVDWLTPYKDNLALLSDGNHELGIVKHCNFDPLNAICNRLRDRGSNVTHGPIGGWFRWRIRASGNTVKSKLFAYHHGAQGGGEVTKGVLKTARRAAYRGQADVLVSGHIHESWQLELIQERVNKRGEINLHTQSHICLPTYKQEYKQVSNWHRTREATPKPLGAVLAKISLSRQKKDTVLKMNFQRLT